jgi:hypothetical protein
MLPVLLVLVESGLRRVVRSGLMAQISGAFRQDPITGFSLAPNLELPIEVKELELHFTMDTNAAGFRGKDLIPKKPGECRLLVLGDSFAYGFGVPSEYAFPAVLEKLLAASDSPQISVYNYGVPSFGTIQELALYRHSGPDVDADAVILEFFDNDFRDNVARYQYVDGFLMQDPALFLGHPLFLNEVIVKEILGIRMNANADGLDTTRALLTEMKELAESRTQPMLVAHIPDRERTRFALEGRTTPLKRESMLPEVPGMAAVDLLSTLEAASDTPFSMDHHLNALGHRLVAEALVPWSTEVCRNRGVSSAQAELR